MVVAVAEGSEADQVISTVHHAALGGLTLNFSSQGCFMKWGGSHAFCEHVFQGG